MRFITEYRKLTKELFRDPYPLTRIYETMKKLEGFQYATELCLNMGYYTIILSPTSQDMMTIITEFGIFRYNSILMRMYALGYKFQA